MGKRFQSPAKFLWLLVLSGFLMAEFQAQAHPRRQTGSKKETDQVTTALVVGVGGVGGGTVQKDTKGETAIADGMRVKKGGFYGGTIRGKVHSAMGIGLVGGEVNLDLVRDHRKNKVVPDMDGTFEIGFRSGASGGTDGFASLEVGGTHVGHALNHVGEQGLGGKLHVGVMRAQGDSLWMVGPYLGATQRKGNSEYKEVGGRVRIIRGPRHIIEAQGAAVFDHDINGKSGVQGWKAGVSADREVLPHVSVGFQGRAINIRESKNSEGETLPRLTGAEGKIRVLGTFY